jgi:FkbM family methyltransferase
LNLLGIDNYITTVSKQYTSSVPGSISADDVDNKFDKYILIFTIGRVPQGLSNLLSNFKNAVKIYYAAYERSGYISQDFLKNHIKEFEQTMLLLHDDFSRGSLYMFIKASLLQDASIIIPSFVTPTYFQSDILALHKIEHFVDCGAFDGDSIRDFYKYTNNLNARVTAYEPEDNLFKRLAEYVGNLQQRENISLFKNAVFSQSAVLNFDANINGGEMSGALAEEGSISVEAVSIDETAKGPVSFIKADIEGAELSALKGAKQTILRDKPMLALSCYHKQDDVITLPQYIKSLLPEYKLYIRNHTYNLNDMVLYAVI